MSTRGAGYGLDAELARKSAMKYDKGMENEARSWIETCTGVGIGEDFQAGLKDGQLLCILVNKIQPGTIRKVETSRMPFKQMENISNFLKACRVLGVAEHDLFETVDLFEGKDLGVVVTCIHALGRAVQGRFQGPSLGAKVASKNVRGSFKKTDPGDATVGMTKLSMGSSQTMQRSTFNDTKSITFGAKTVGTGSTAHASQQSMGSAGVMQRSQVSTSNSVTFGADAGKKPPTPPVRKWGSNVGRAPPPVPSRASASSPVPVAPSGRGPVGARGGGYGLDAELAAKAAAKYDVGMEAEAQSWIEAVTGFAFSSTFSESLKDGVTLCMLVNKIKPGAVKVNNSKMPFKQMENISNFLKTCRSLGVAEHDLFETVDLYEGKDLGVVVTCIHALGRAVQGVYSGPKLGAKVAQRNERNFTPDQIKRQQASVGMTKLSAGSSGVMQRSTMNDTRDVTFGNKMGGGSGSTGVVGKLAMGSAGVMQRSEVSTSNSVTFGAEKVGTGASGAVGKLAMGSAGVMDRTEVSTSNSVTFGAEKAGTGASGAVGKLAMGSATVMERSEVAKPGVTFGADAGRTSETTMARVLFDFPGTDAGEIPLTEGTLVIVLDKDSDPQGWWKGQNTEGKQGMFPFNYVEIV